MLDSLKLKVLRNENRPEPVDTVLFLGAGASKPFGYPTSKEFIERLRLEESERRWIARFNTIDEVVRHCQKLIIGGENSVSELNTIAQAQAEKIKPLLPEDKRGEGVKIVNNTKDIYGKILKEAESIKEKVIEGIFREYSYKPTTGNYLDKYMQALRKQNGDHLPLFTTNYDPVVENLEESKGYEVNTLFTHHFRGLYKWKGQEAFFGNDKKKNLIHLFKLHGSTYWRWEDGELLEERALSRLEARIKEIIPPGMQLERDRIRKPYITYWDYFDAYLSQAKKAIFLGYRFDDDEIRRFVDDRKLEKIVVVNTEKIGIGWENVVEINKPAQEAVKEVEEQLA